MHRDNTVRTVVPKIRGTVYAALKNYRHYYCELKWFPEFSFTSTLFNGGYSYYLLVMVHSSQ